VAPDGSLTATLQAAIDRKDDAAARHLCQERLRAQPDDAEALRHLGLLEAARGQFGAALESGERACRLAPTDPQCWSELGLVHIGLGNTEDAADRSSLTGTSPKAGTISARR